MRRCDSTTRLVFALGAMALALAARPALAQDVSDPCTLPTPHTSITSCTVGNDVVIGAGAPSTACQGKVYDDSNRLAVGKITINSGGSLLVVDQTASTGSLSNPVILSTSGIQVGGTFMVGSADCPIGYSKSAAHFTITFTTPGGKLRPAGCTGTQTCPGYDKGIEIESGGTLKMYGQTGAPGPDGKPWTSWTYLSQPAGPRAFMTEKGVKARVPAGGDKTLQLAADVTTGHAAWQPDDWIVVAGTGFSPFDGEFVQISKLAKNTDGGTTITLKQSLRNYHFGGKDPGPPGDANYAAGSDLNFGVDERAEVGLITRNITLTADTPASGPDDHYGGELKFLPGFAAVELQGVELQKFGKDELGAYPIHLHMDDDVGNKPIVRANSIDHSYNKCITVHSTRNVTIQDNVCARITGHIFYEERGDETNVTFTHNLGVGAMSNSFDINGNGEVTRQNLIDKYWWPGDNMVIRSGGFGSPLGGTFLGFGGFGFFSGLGRPGAGLGDVDARPTGLIAFDGLNIPDTDDPTDPAHGECEGIDVNGAFFGGGVPSSKGPPNPSCTDANLPIYYEPATGFWIANPSAKLSGNSIAGCQGAGKGYWYVPQGNAQFIPIGPQSVQTDKTMYGLFTNNRVHGCYSGLYDEPEHITSGQLFGYQNGEKSGTSRPVVDEFDGVTATRNRNRGIWIRPLFYVMKDARLATSKHEVTLLTSGGPDGNYPGAWSLFTDSVVIGLSQNNVDRFGPCPVERNLLGIGQIGGGSWGCIDQTKPEASAKPTGGDLILEGYPIAIWNLFGYMIYDGPPLIFHDRFVNFKQQYFKAGSEAGSGDLDADDQKYLADNKIWRTPQNNVYEGDAAYGWFDSNQSEYPDGAVGQQLSFTNTDLRHQIYTQEVNTGVFNDGDKNTIIGDLDGTLSGFLTTQSLLPDSTAYPFSLNNLEINASSNSVDECLSEGTQDAKLEGRPTSAMVPGSIGSLEFESLFPKCNYHNGGGDLGCNTKPDPNPEYNYTQLITFTKDSVEFPTLKTNFHPAMSLHSRNGLGAWEPKVTSGYGYTIGASPFTFPVTGGRVTDAGIPAHIQIGLVDVIKPAISTNPFVVRVGVCYSDTNGNHPTDGSKFTIKQGYKSWGGSAFEPSDTELQKYFNNLATCFNLDGQNPATNLAGCPAQGITPTTIPCEGDSTMVGSQCVYPTHTLTQVNTIGGLLTSGKPDLAIPKYFYDPTTGMLFFYVAQVRPNAEGPSPLGQCTGDPGTDPSFCPELTSRIHYYYVCPPEGCETYTVDLNDTYTPGTSTCTPYETYTQSEPTGQDTLVYSDNTTTAVVRNPQGGLDNNFPHYVASTAPTCPVNPP
jgi:G8 domain